MAHPALGLSSLSPPHPGFPLLGSRLSVFPSWVSSLSFPAAMQCLYNLQWLLQNCLPPTLPDKGHLGGRERTGTWAWLVARLVFWGSPGETAGASQKRFLSQSLARRSLSLSFFMVTRECAVADMMGLGGPPWPCLRRRVACRHHHPCAGSITKGLC